MVGQSTPVVSSIQSTPAATATVTAARILEGQMRGLTGEENALFFDVEGNPEKIDIIYRFFELFDLENIRTQRFIFEAWQAGEVAIEFLEQTDQARKNQQRAYKILHKP